MKIDELEAQKIAASDKETLAKLSNFLEKIDWHEKIAVGQTAYFFIDNTHHKILKLTPVQGLSEPMKHAMQLIENLSPQALAELATELLEETPALDEEKDDY